MTHLFDTKEAYTTSVNAIKAEIKSLSIAVNALPGESDSLKRILDSKTLLLDTVTKMKTWNFNFEGGGWNSVSARTKEEAIKAAQDEYNETKADQRYHCVENGGGAIQLTKVKESSFRLETEADTKQLLSSFY